MTDPRAEVEPRFCEEPDCGARPHRLVIESHDFSGESSPAKGPWDWLRHELDRIGAHEALNLVDANRHKIEAALAAQPEPAREAAQDEALKVAVEDAVKRLFTDIDAARSEQGAELREALRRLLESEKVSPPVVAGMEWPARCWDCAFTTEDPDAYAGEDQELVEPERLCPVTSTWHRWVPAGLVRYIPADTLAVFRSYARLASTEPSAES
jgi:hypothetical protein